MIVYVDPRLLFEKHQVSYDNQNYNGHRINNSMKKQRHYQFTIIVCYIVTPLVGYNIISTNNCYLYIIPRLTHQSI